MKTVIAFISLTLFLGFDPSSAPFNAPIHGEASVELGYGMHRHPVLNTERLHEGIDYKTEVGTPVYSSNRGIITFIDTKSTYGKLIIIKHEDGFETYYAHLSEFNSEIKVGDTVNTDQYIGKTGETGVAMGPHLHFEIHKDGKAVDPASYLTN